MIGGIAGIGRWQCRCPPVRCSGATSRWRPCGLAARVCGLSADFVHGGKALCMTGWSCIENIGLTCALLCRVDHARPWWPPAPWDTCEVQRSANLCLCGWAPQYKCSGGNSTSVSLTFSLCSFGTCGCSCCVGNQRPCQTSGRATVQSADTPPPPTQGSRQPGSGEGRGPREH